MLQLQQLQGQGKEKLEVGCVESNVTVERLSVGCTVRSWLSACVGCQLHTEPSPSRSLPSPCRMGTTS